MSRRSYQLVGSTVGKWAVLYQLPDRKTNRGWRLVYYRCRCGWCEQEFDVRYQTLTRLINEGSKDGGCRGCYEKRVGRADEEDITGLVSHELTARRRHPERNPSGAVQWYCDCTCGKTDYVTTAYRINDKRAKSCGHLRRAIGTNNLKLAHARVHTRVCLGCEAEFKATAGQVHCSVECRNGPYVRPPGETPCAQCGRGFDRGRFRGRYCSSDCKKIAKGRLAKLLVHTDLAVAFAAEELNQGEHRVNTGGPNSDVGGHVNDGTEGGVRSAGGRVGAGDNQDGGTVVGDQAAGTELPGVANDPGSSPAPGGGR